jgi:hypothetical protein
MKRFNVHALTLTLLLAVTAVSSSIAGGLYQLNEEDAGLMSKQSEQTRARDGDCVWWDYACDPYYYSYIPSDEDGDPFAQRFTFIPPKLCTLYTIEMTLYNGYPEFSDISGMGIDCIVWDDDGSGFPGDEVARFNVPSAELVYYPEALSIDVQLAGLVFDDDFHIGFTTVDQVNDCYGIMLDDGSCGYGGSSHYYLGMWETVLEHFGADVNFLIAAEVCPISEPGVSISISGPGAGDGDSIYCGQPVTFNVRLYNDTGYDIMGLTNGFVITSPDGCSWDIPVIDTAGGIGDYLSNVNIGGNADGISPDTVWIGAAFMMGDPGVPNGYDDVILRITTMVDSSDSGKTIVIDSTFFPPAGSWKWATTGGEVIPNWYGPYSYGTKCWYHTVFGYKYLDLDQDHFWGLNEPALPNWTINIYDYANPGTLLGTTTTDANGRYCFGVCGGGFSGPYPPNYPQGMLVTEDLQQCWVQTFPFPLYPQGHIVPSIGLNGKDYGPCNFGNFPTDTLGRISGTKFHDMNANGAWETWLGEGVIAGIPISLTGPVSMNTTTDQQGEYTFAGLPPGTYKVSETVSSPWAQTHPASVFHNVTVQMFDNILGKDFGNDSCDVEDYYSYDSCLHGTDDNFVAPEPSFISPGLLSHLQTSCYDYNPNFDSPCVNQCFGHTFDNCWTSKCLVVGAELCFKVRATGSIPGTDALALGEYGPNGTGSVFSILMNDLEEYCNPGSSPWQLNDVLECCIDLTNLPDAAAGGHGSTNILAAIQDGNLDIIFQDDTEVDYLKMRVTVNCPDSGACCDCDSLNDAYCFYTDRQVCSDSNGTFYAGLTCDDVQCDTCYACGDINNDGVCLTVADLVFLKKFLLYGGTAPDLLYQADLNCDEIVDMSDYNLYEGFFIYGISVFTCGYPVPTTCCPELGTVYVPGDADGSSDVDIDDVVYLIGYIFSGGPAPDPLETGDADCSDDVDIDDVVYLINYIFAGGPAPGETCP